MALVVASPRDSGRRAKETMRRETLVPTRLFLVKMDVGAGQGRGACRWTVILAYCQIFVLSSFLFAFSVDVLIRCTQYVDPLFSLSHVFALAELVSMT